MTTVLGAIETFLKDRRATHNGPDLLDRWTRSMETQVNVSPDGGEPVEGRQNTWTDGATTWWHIRVPKKAKSEPEFSDYELRWSLDKHVEAIGSTGWDWVNKRSRWLGFDFDAIAEHAKGIGITPEEMDCVKATAQTVPWIETRKSTGGGGLHLYVYFDDEGVETANHNEHAALGRAILSKLSAETEFDFNAHVDRCGSNMWIWHRKMTTANGGLTLIKAAERALSAADVPENWRDELRKPVLKHTDGSNATTEPGSLAKALVRAIAAMLRINTPDHSDGSRRVYTYACRGVEHDLTDQDIVAAIRECEKTKPFPRSWSDTQIIERIRDAEDNVERGCALTQKPEVDVTQGDLDKLTRDVWKHVEGCNDPPALFRYGGAPVRVEHDDNGEPIPRGVGIDQMRNQLAQWLHFTKITAGKGIVACAPPVDLVKNVLATADMPLPILDRITEAPIFAADGLLQTTPGYHAASRTLFIPKGRFQVPSVSASPSEDEIIEARNLIVTELLSDFPFTNDSERAHAVSLLLLPFARTVIKGATPLHLFEKPSPGTGATLLVDVLTFPATGHPVATMTEGSSEEEWRKRLTAKLRTSPTFLLIDNLRQPLDSATVSSAITAPAWEDRILGISQMIKLPVRCAWVATGNNPTLSTEISRRTVRIRLNAKMDRPWLRDAFRHEDLRGWAMEHRPRLVWAALTLIQAWVAKGQPLGIRALGMFEDWSRVMGGILDVAGIPGFLANLTEFYDQADTEGAAWREFLATWHGKFGDKEVLGRELVEIATEGGAINLGTGGDQSQKVKLGKLLADMRDRVFNVEVSKDTVLPLRVENAGTKARATLWRLQRASEFIAA